VTEMRFPLGLSVAGHAVCLALLISLLPTRIAPLPEPTVPAGVEVIFAPLPRPEEQPAQPQTPPLQAETPSPQPEPPLPEPAPPEPPVAATELPQPPEPPPPAVETPAPVSVPLPPPVPPKPVVKPPLKPVHRRIEKAQPNPAAPSAQPGPAVVAAPQTAYVPAPLPVPVLSPEASRGYGALVSAWLNSHKRYPESARQRGEEGRVNVRFEIDRTGRVIDFAVTKSSGYPDLDTAVDEMIRNATFPPFPVGMTESRFPVVVTLTFRLER